MSSDRKAPTQHDGDVNIYELDKIVPGGEWNEEQTTSNKTRKSH